MTATTLAALVYGLGWVPLFVFRVETHGEALRLYDPHERAAARLAPVVLSVHVTLACLYLTLGAGAGGGWLAAGAMCWAAALALWAWGRVRIGPPRQRRRPDEPPLVFRRDGPFGLVRHPLYAGYLLAAFAPVVATAQPLVLLTFVACFALLARRAVQEESRLRSQLGEAYEAYCRRVKRLIPFVW